MTKLSAATQTAHVAGTPGAPDWKVALQLIRPRRFNRPKAVVGKAAEREQRQTGNRAESRYSKGRRTLAAHMVPETSVEPIETRFATHADPLRPLTPDIASGIEMSLDSANLRIEDIELAMDHMLDLDDVSELPNAKGLTDFELKELQDGQWRRDLVMKLCHLDWRTLIADHGERARVIWLDVLERNLEYRDEAAVFTLPVIDIYLLRYILDEPELLADLVEQSRDRVRGAASEIDAFISLKKSNNLSPFEVVSMRNADDIFHSLMAEVRRLIDANPYDYPHRLLATLLDYENGSKADFQVYTGTLKVKLAAA